MNCSFHVRQLRLQDVSSYLIKDDKIFRTDGYPTELIHMIFTKPDFYGTVMGLAFIFKNRLISFGSGLIFRPAEPKPDPIWIRTKPKPNRTWYYKYIVCLYNIHITLYKNGHHLWDYKICNERIIVLQSFFITHYFKSVI